MMKWWKIFRQSLKGEHHDLTEGDLRQAVVLLAIPMVLEIGLESVFAIVDMYFVSRLGQNAIATVGLTESVITIVYSLSIGLSVGATAVVARRIGEKNPEGASHAAAQSLVIGLILSALISLPSAYFADDILRLMGAGPEVVEQGASFTRIMMSGSLVIVMLFLINGIFRGAGNAAMAMKSLWIASGVNIVLCPILIHFFGLPGAASATVIGRGTGMLYQLWHLRKGDGEIKLKRSHFQLDLPVLKSISLIAWPATFQFLIGSGSWIVLTRMIAESGGTPATAAYQIAMRNFMFFILPAWGLSNAAATLVGQNLGAKKWDRAEESVRITNQISAVMMLFVTAFFLIFAGPLIRIFSTDPVVIDHGITFLRIVGSGFLFYGVGMVLIQALNGAGATGTSTWVNFFSFWVFQTPLAYLLAFVLDWGALGVVIAIPIAQGVMTGLAWWVFRRGRWKTIQV